MQTLLCAVAVGSALLVGLRVYVAVWRGKCPRCGVRALRHVGTAAIYLPPSPDGPFDIRFAEAHCDACGLPAYRRLGVAASWETEMRAVPQEPLAPPLTAPGGASEIVFDESAPSESRRQPHE